MTAQTSRRSRAGELGARPWSPAGRASAADRALVERLLAGDEGAFRALVERHHGRLVRLAQPFVSSRAVAEEVAQETWLAVLQGLPGFTGRSSLKTWIFSILLNRARSRGAKEGRTVPLSAIGKARGPPPVEPRRFDSRGHWAHVPSRWDEPGPEKTLLGKESLSVVERALAALPPGQRAVLLLHDVEQLDADEVCSLLDISEVNQRVLLHRARSRIRRELERYFGGAEKA